MKLWDIEYKTKQDGSDILLTISTNSMTLEIFRIDVTGQSSSGIDLTIKRWIDNYLLETLLKENKIKLTIEDTTKITTWK